MLLVISRVSPAATVPAASGLLKASTKGMGRPPFIESVAFKELATAKVIENILEGTAGTPDKVYAELVPPVVP